MTFEDEKLQEAMQVLKDMEKRCAQDMGWMKTVKNKVFGAATAVRTFRLLKYLKLCSKRLNINSNFSSVYCS